MLKKIKKSIKYFIIMFGIALMVPTFLYLLLQTAAVQTYIVKKITRHFSNELRSTISVGSVDYKFFNKLSLKKVLIKDQHLDTLLFSNEINIAIRNISLRNKSFSFGKIMLIKPEVALITDTTGQMNLSWFLSQLSGSSDSVNKSPVTFSVSQIDLIDAKFSLVNRMANKGKNAIDFASIHLTGLNGTVGDLSIENDSVTFNVYNLAFRESSGFILNELTGLVTFAEKKIILDKSLISVGKTVLNIPHFELRPDSAEGFANFTENVRLDISLEKSLISTTDLKYFVALPDSLIESVWLSGRIYGTISELRGRKIMLSYRDYTTLDCDFDFSGLPKIENTFLYIGVNKLITNARDLEDISLNGKNTIIIPDAVRKLGNISFNGSFTGFTTDFVTYGEIRTVEGNIRTDISLRPEKGRYRIKGLITGSEINLGNLTDNSELFGKVSMKANIDGYAHSLKKFDGNLTGKIDSIEIKQYTYRNITLNGLFTEKTWDGSVNILDPNIKLSLLGLLNFENELPEFDFTLNVTDANLFSLHFDKLDSTARVTMLVTSNFKGNNIDNLDGEIKLLNSSFIKWGNKLALYDFSIRTYKEAGEPVLSLRSDFVDADIRGYYNFAALGGLVRTKLTKLMPSQFSNNSRPVNPKRNNFTFQINFKNTDKINVFLRTGVSIATNSIIKGSILADSMININGQADHLTIKKNVFENFLFDARVSGSELSMAVNSSSIKLLGQSELKDFSVGIQTIPDNFTFKVDWNNKDTLLNKGNITAHGNLTKSNIGKQNTILRVDIDSSSIYSDNNHWKLNQSTVFLDSSSVSIRSLSVKSNDRYYMVDGSVSEDPSDTLRLDFKGIGIEPLNLLLNKDRTNDPNALQINIEGIINGNILLSNVYKDLLLAGNLTLNDFSILGSNFGNIDINATLDNVKKVVRIGLSNDFNNLKNIDVSGVYDPSSKKLNLDAIADKLPISFLNPLLKTFASEINGYASGKLRFSAEANNIFLLGALKTEDASMKINFLQTKYTINDSIRFNKKGIVFNSVNVADVRGNLATLSGTVNHINFKEYFVNLTANINSSNFQVLNTLPRDNEMFYGTAYASGLAKIRIDKNTLSFDISAKTGKNTKLAIPLNRGLSVSEYSYITFEDADAVKTQAKKESEKPAAAKQAGIELNINLEVTPDAEVEIIFDSKVGDVMKGYGSSENLNVNLNKKGDFKITGDYIIEDGDYTFTLGNIINKPFSVENGGKIMFIGDLDDAEIEINARYLNLKASLSPILPEEKYAERIRVEPQLSLSGKLFNPMVGFDIVLPDADEETRTYLRNSIATEEELTRQVFSLLLMNSFISVGSTATTSANISGTSAMAKTTFEMVSSQISNWLSQISKDVDIGVLIRPGYNDITPQEAQLALSTQILNNKVVLNTNVDVRGTGATTTNNTDKFTGDFDAEVKLTEKLRFKVFSRYNDTYMGTGISPYTQGVGIFYKQDFNKFIDLIRRKNKTDMKKEDDTEIKNNNDEVVNKN